MSYKPMVLVQHEWAGNSLRFATREEAEIYATDLQRRWTLCVDHRVDDSDDPVNYKWDAVKGLVALPPEEITPNKV